MKLSISLRAMLLLGVALPVAAAEPAKPADVTPVIKPATASTVVKPEEKPVASLPPLPVPTLANVPYGQHERQVLDFYQAKSTKPTPLLFFIHGGGWVNGNKGRPGSLVPCLNAGISVVSINYRLN